MPQDSENFVMTASHDALLPQADAVDTDERRPVAEHTDQQ